jgi:N-acetylmuramoyl-L-alanine amidase
MSFLEGLLWLTLNVYHEARSEPTVGQLAVAHVTLNRAAEKQESIEKVVTAPYQFSWTFQKESIVPTESDALWQSMRSALQAMTGPDFTNGATYYHRFDIAPEWSVEKVYVARFGDHLFYRN